MESKVKLLIIDDDQIDRVLLARFLELSGLSYELTESDDPIKAMENVVNNHYDCIFLDYLMPGMNGLSFLKKLRDIGIKTPVVVTTSQGSESIAVELMKAGAADYIVKSLMNHHTVRQILSNVLRMKVVEEEREAAIWAKELSEARLAEAQSIAKIGNWEIEPSGRVYWSTEMYKIFGLDPNEFTPAINNFGIFHQDDSQLLTTTLQQALEGNPFNIDLRILTPSGVKYVNARGYALFSDQGKPNRIIGTTQDISERKLAEQEILKAREQAEHSMKVREVFLTNMSHEIRTPMNAILGFTRLLYDTTLTQEQKSFLDAIHFSGENLLVIINDILDLSKIQSGKMVFEKVEFNLNDLIKGIVTIFKQKAAEKGLQFNCQIRQHVPHVVKGDPVRLSQVLTNLISNAIKFTEKGSVSLEVKCDPQNIGRHAIDFKVTDTGIGIPEDKQTVIFESFVQASQDTSRKFGGTGLGLAIVKSIVELQEGNITLNSAPGAGSEFSVNLSFDRAEKSIYHKEHEVVLNDNAQPLKGASILVVEDNAVNQLLVKKVLQKFGCKTDVASNGLKAIENLKTGRYDAVLMDIQMPEMDGYEATAFIRKNLPAPLCNIPVIAMTAHAFHSEIEKSTKAGMNDYITKPFKQELLLEVLCKYVNKENETKVIPLHQPKDTAFIIDLNPLYELGKNDEEFVSEIIRVYDKQTQKFTERLRDAMRSHDHDMIRSICHQIKGSYGMLRMNELSKTLEEVAVIFRSGETKTQFLRINFLVNNIISLISAVNEEVKRKLRQTA